MLDSLVFDIPPSSNTISTPERKLGEEANDKQVQRDEKGVVNEQNKDKKHEEQPRKDEEEEKDEQREEEQPEGKQTEDEQQERVTIQENSVSALSSESDTSLEKVNQYGYLDKGHFKHAIFSYCEGVQWTFVRTRLQDFQCCSLCKIHANNSLKYVCNKHVS